MSVQMRCWAKPGECDRPHQTRKVWQGEAPFHVEYEGAVLATREENWPDDSDFYALVWTGEKISRVDYATTRYATDDNSAFADATDEVKAAAGEYAVRMMRPLIEQGFRDESMQPMIGRRVRLTAAPTRGKYAGIPVGTEGRVFWAGESRSQYGTWSRGWRLGVQPDEGDVFFTAANRVEVVDPEQFMPTDAELDTLAEQYRTNPVGAILARSARPGLVVVA